MNALVLISRLATSGAETVTVGFMRRLLFTEHKASVCTVTGRHDGPLAKELEASGVVRHDLKARRLADPQALKRLVKLMKDERPDIIHAHGQDAAILAATARLISSKPLVITRHVMDEPKENWRQTLRAKMAVAAFRRADSVVAVSAATADRLSVLTRLPRTRIRVIPNGIDLEPFRSPGLSELGVELRRSLGFMSHDRVLLLPAALRNGKGHDLLLAALPGLLKHIPHLRIVFAGSGDLESDLKGRAKPFGHTIVFVGNYKKMPELFACCDLVVLPSLSEALPTVLIEAAAAGKPVVATRVGGSAEVVSDGRTGILVPPNHPQALAEAIVEMLGNPERMKAWGAAARELAAKRYSIDLQAQRTLDLWSRTIKQEI